MQDAILTHFPPYTHPLTLVSDPDGVLADEGILAALAGRGFTLVNEPDPLALRHRVEDLRPWSLDHPLVVVTAGALEQLPYDLWQQGRHVTLALHTFFPNLAYPLVRALAPSQRHRLDQVALPSRRLGRRGTLDFLLRWVFAADLAALRQPAHFVGWLDRLHQQAEPLPAVLAAHLLASLRHLPAYADWPLAELLASREAFTVFVREQWRAYVQQQTGELLRDEPLRYLLDFGDDCTLQDTLPGLLRSGTLEPLSVAQPGHLPGWARSAILAPDEDRRPRRVAALLDFLAEHLEAGAQDARWEQWQALARAWAELTALCYDPGAPLAQAHQSAYQGLQDRVDAAFLAWLRGRYGPLGGQRLPLPHHVHHVPHYLAYRRRQGGTERVALLVLDGLALADWMQVGPAWRARHPAWRFEEHLVLAQVPTITAVSRQALVSGLRPADSVAALTASLAAAPAATPGTAQSECALWAAFWAREGLPADDCPLVHLALERAEPPPEVDSAHTCALCLVDSKVDDLVHDAALGAPGFQASLRVWLEQYSPRLEQVIAGLLARDFTVYLASDHGHVQACGFGQPSEGLTVDTRGRRARIYRDRHAAVSVQQAFPDTILWSDDGLLPGGVWVLMPQGRNAFTTFNETVVTHGGPTLDEVVVPLVAIVGCTSELHE